MALTKKLLAENLAAKFEISPYKADKIIDEIFDEIIEAGTSDEGFALKGIFSIKVVDAKERTGRNPSTGETITIPAKKRVKITPGLRFKNAIS